MIFDWEYFVMLMIWVLGSISFFALLYCIIWAIISAINWLGKRIFKEGDKMYEKIGVMKNGKAIYINDRTKEHMAAHADVKMEDIKEAISLIEEYNGQFMIDAIDLGRVVGKSHCVVLKVGDNAGYFYRKGRQGKTHMVFDREPDDTTSIVIGICKDRDTGLDVLFTSWYGVMGEKEPWDPSIKTEEERLRCVKFWNIHALTNVESIDWERERRLYL